jgi:hypothetical protein
MSKLIWLGVALVIAGIASGILEDTFYGGRVDENNVLQESFFLPLAFILFFFGGVLIVVTAVFGLMKKMRGMRN